MDINVILSDQIFEPFEIRELEIIMKVEMTNSKSPNPTLNHFCAAEWFSNLRPFLDSSLHRYIPVIVIPGHQDFSFKSSLVINLPKCHDVANSS